MGNSFGGIETVFGAERYAYCAAVDLTGDAISWDEAPALRARLIKSVRHTRAPMLFIQAENDFTTEPSKVLYASAREAHKEAKVHIYPPFKGAGEGGMQGHSFAWLGRVAVVSGSVSIHLNTLQKLSAIQGSLQIG